MFFFSSFLHYSNYLTSHILLTSRFILILSCNNLSRYHLLYFVSIVCYFRSIASFLQKSVLNAVILHPCSLIIHVILNASCRTHSLSCVLMYISVSYTHLDVYKRQKKGHLYFNKNFVKVRGFIAHASVGHFDPFSLLWKNNIWLQLVWIKIIYKLLLFLIIIVLFNIKAFYNCKCYTFLPITFSGYILNNRLKNHIFIILM